MQVDIIAFGDISNIIGKNRITLKNIPNTDQLKLQLQRLYPALKNTPYLIAIDRHIISENTRLKDNHMIALLPQASAGSREADDLPSQQ